MAAIKVDGLIDGTKLFFYNIYYNYLYKYNKEKILKIISKRKGSCNGCGSCCILATRGRCEHLGRDNKCNIYSKRDILGWGGCIYPPYPHSFKLGKYNKIKFKNCGYYYKK